MSKEISGVNGAAIIGRQNSLFVDIGSMSSSPEAIELLENEKFTCEPFKGGQVFCAEFQVGHFISK